MYEQITIQTDIQMPDEHMDESPDVPGDIVIQMSRDIHMDILTDVWIHGQTDGLQTCQLTFHITHVTCP